jgi:hypothetical protein
MDTSSAEATIQANVRWSQIPLRKPTGGKCFAENIIRTMNSLSTMKQIGAFTAIPLLGSDMRRVERGGEGQGVKRMIFNIVSATCNSNIVS